MFEKVQQKVHKGWSTTKKLLAWLSVWGLIFSLVTIGRLRVAFDYDDTLVFSTPAFNKAFKSGVQEFSPQFWTIVNQSYDLEEPKIMTNAMAWILRAFGFKITILTSRPPEGGEALKKEWRRLASAFVFVPDQYKKHLYLNQGRYVLYFGDSDADITEGRLAHVLTLRIRRSPRSSYKSEYSPKMLGEFVIPFSEY
jgi:acid phosphatase class B